MFKSLKKFINDGVNNGFPVPLAKGTNKKPSVTLWFAYVTFWLAVCATVYFIYKGDPLSSTVTAIGFWTIAMVFFRMNKIDKFKIDFDDREIELDSENEKVEKKEVDDV